MGPTTQFCTSDNPRTRQLRKDIRQLFVPDLGQGRVHHQDETHGDGEVGGTDGESAPELGNTEPQGSHRYPHTHGQKDPQRQVSVQE